MAINPIGILNICLLTNQIKIIKIKVFSVELKNQISFMEVDLSISFYRNKSHLRTQGLKRYFWSPRVSTRIIVRTADHYSEKRNRKTHFDFDIHTWINTSNDIYDDYRDYDDDDDLGKLAVVRIVLLLLRVLRGDCVFCNGDDDDGNYDDDDDDHNGNW